MSQLDKLIARIRTRPPEADFADVETLLLAYGYESKRQAGSHVTFKKPGRRSIIIALVKGRKVKRVYLDMLCDILGLDD